MANTKITDLTSLTAAAGDEIPVNRAGSDGKVTALAIANLSPDTFLELTDTPDAYTGFGGLGHAGAMVGVNNAGTGLEFKWSTAEYIDIRDYSATPLVSGDDITTAFQAALDAWTTHGLSVFFIPHCGDNGFYTWSPASNTFSGKDTTIMVATRTIKLGSVYVVRDSTRLMGVSIDGNFTFNSGPGWCPEFRDLNGNLTSGVLKMSGNTQIENISVAATAGPAISAFGTNLFTIRDVKATTTAAANAIEINECFWVTIENVYASPRSAGDWAGIGFYNSATVPSGSVSLGGTDCGLIRIKELRADRGPAISFQADLGPVGTRNIEVVDVIGENMVDGVSLITFDSSALTAFVGEIRIVRPSIADNLGAAYFMKNTGTNTKGIRFEHTTADDISVGFIDPTSDPIEMLCIDNSVGNCASLLSANIFNDIYPGTAQALKWSRVFPSSYDGKLACAPVGPTWTIGTPLPIMQDPAGWTGTVTTGKLGPDGSLYAGRVSGAGNCFSAAVTLSVDDWVIGGVWCRSTTGGDIAGASVTISMAGGDYDGSSAEPNLLNQNPEESVGNDGWRWLSFAHKVTSGGSVTVGFNLGATRDYFAPCMIHVLAADAIDDATAVRAARSLKGGWNSNSAAGHASTLPHQKMYAGSGVAVKAVTAPSAEGGWCQLYVDDSDGDLKAKFEDGSVVVVASGPTPLLAGETTGFACDFTTTSVTPRVEIKGGLTSQYTNASSFFTYSAGGISGTKYLKNSSTTIGPVTFPIAYGQGLCIEQAVTNICLQSEDLATTWTNSNSTETTNATTDPMGTSTADKIVTANDVAQIHSVVQSISVTSGSAYVFSCYLKKAGMDWARLNIATTRFPDNVYCDFDLANGLEGTNGAGATTAGIESIGNGWYRCWVGATADSTGANDFSIIVGEADTDVTFNGDGTVGTFAWGAQLEVVPASVTVLTPTSYIPTTTASQARAADAVSCSTSKMRYFDSTVPMVGSVVCWVTPHHANHANSDRLWEFSNASSSNLIFAVTNTADTPDSYGAGILNNSSGLVGQGVTKTGSASVAGNKVAVAWQVNNTGIVVDGSAEVTDTSCDIDSPTNLSTGLAAGNLYLGYAGATANREFNGFIRRIIYVPRRMTAAQMITATS